ncbi:MAG: cyclase family protein [Deltaproteobacteria bacterium]
MSRHICLSHIISQDTPSYGNRDRIFIRTNSAIQKGDSSNSSAWIFSNNHIGTHIDSPYHVNQDGKKTYEIPVDDYVFNHVRLVDIPCTGARLIGIEDFKKAAPLGRDMELLLIRTGFENLRHEECYWNDNPGIAPESANYLRENYPDLRCIGFDFLSLTSWKYRVEGRQSHKEFLCPAPGQKVLMVIEDMSLKAAGNKINWVVVAPFFAEDGNGGTVTVFANQEI